MRKLLLLAFLLLTFFNSRASHFMAGEITWECIKDQASPDFGKYIFRMKLYRDCDGTTLTTGTQTLTVWGSGVNISSIPLNWIVSNDISPDCDVSNSGNVALDCINNNKNLKILNEQFNNKVLNQSGLLSIKPKIYVCNVDEKSVQNGNKYTKDFINKFGDKNTLIVSAEIENQINQLENDEKTNYMKMIGLKKTGLNMLIQKGYNVLELETFFTSGPEETRAWTIQKNCSAQKAAGEIHTDFEKGFIRAEAIAYEDFIKNQGWVNSRTNGKMRLEGKDYIIKDGDILNFRFNT